jgi:Tol biopolymer transport system component
MKANALHYRHESPTTARFGAAVFTRLFVVAFAVFAQVAVLPAESVSVLLQKGIFAEETERDLDAAISIYQRIIAQEKENQSLVGQAQYRLGVCLLKKGKNQEATQTFQDIVNHFLAQTDLVAQARTRLSELGPPTSGVENLFPAKEATTADAAPKLLTHPNAQRWQALSPNGQRAAFVESYPDRGLVIEDLETGQSWRIENAVRNTEGGTRGSPVFSPDGGRLAYYWWTSGTARELRIATVGHTNFTLLARVKAAVSLRDWSTDGLHLLGIETAGEFEDFEMVLVSAKDGTSKTVPLGYSAKEIDKIDVALFTANGRHIVFQGPKGIEAFDLLNQELRTLIAHPAWTKLVGRVPGTSSFLFAGERSGKRFLYAFDVVDGEVKGEPREVMDYQDREFLAATHDGSAYYRVRHSSQTIHVAGVDFGTGKVVEASREIGRPVAGDKSTPVWSWDGKRLAWQSQGGMLLIQDQQNLTHRGFTWSGKLRGAAIYPYRSWSPDGKTFLVLSFPVDGSPGIYSIDGESGDIQPVVTRKWSGGDGAWVGQPQFSTDGRSVFFYRRIFSEDAPYTLQGYRLTDRVMRRHLKSGAEEELYLPKGVLNTYGAFALSPDEGRLALVMTESQDDYHIDIVELRTGVVRRLYECRIRGGGPLSSLNWTPNGEALVFLRYYSNAENDRAVLRVNASTGEVIPIDLGMNVIDHLSLHPDGRQVLFGVLRDRTEMFKHNAAVRLTPSK